MSKHSISSADFTIAYSVTSRDRSSRTADDDLAAPGKTQRARPRRGSWQLIAPVGGQARRVGEANRSPLTRIDGIAIEFSVERWPSG
ncbi:MAG: hypothetical protein JO322_11285 [Candidatus Eremiobacteraeota bacterium]|nr:hypothetical protein [Candidatus Eremiobacteraeota bacterium]